MNMNMIKEIVLKMILPLLSALPIQRVVAMYLNSLLDKIDSGNIEKARLTAKHLGELSELFGDILEDKAVTPEELSRAKEFVLAVRENVLSAWAKGRSAKQIQLSMGEVGLKGSYVEDAEVIQ